MQSRRDILRSLCAAAAPLPPPYHDRRAERVAHADAPEQPFAGGDVPIGYFGPADDVYSAVQRVFDEANRGGGWQGKPFRLVQKWTDDPWRAGGRLVIEMAYVDSVRAVIGPADSAAVHVAAQVAVKARIPLLDPLCTDRTVNAAMSPWTFSCLPADPEIAAALAGRLAEECGAQPFTLVSSTGHGDRLLARELLRAFAALKRAPLRHVEFKPGSPPQLEGSLFLIAGSASDSAAMVAGNPRARFYGGPAAGRREFLRRCPSAHGVRYPVLAQPGCGADYAVAQSADAARLLLAAIGRAGVSRVAIRQALVDLSPWRGPAGEIRWNALNRNTRPVSTAALDLSGEWEMSVIKES